MNNYQLTMSLQSKMLAISNLDSYDYFSLATVDYLNYISKNIENIGDILDKIISNNMIPIEELAFMGLSYNIPDFTLEISEQSKTLKTEGYGFLPNNKSHKKLMIEKELKILYDMKREDAENLKYGKPIINIKDIPTKRSQGRYYYLTVLHDNIIEALSSSQNKPSLTFESKSSVLYVNGKNINITKNKNIYYLLKTLFKNKNKEWSYDEIADDWGENYSKDSWKKFYDAGYRLNGKVAKDTGLQDFLYLSNKTVSINKVFLKK